LINFLLINIIIKVINKKVKMASCETITIFTIITTGIADNTSDSINHLIFGLLELFLNTLCSNITKCIPDNFQQILIYHHDILIRFDTSQHSYINNTLNQLLFKARPTLDSRIFTHNFSHQPLDMLNLPRNHLIIDMAHIFAYGLNKQVIWNNIYTRPYIQISRLSINSIYTKWNDYTFARKKLIEISPDGNVRTYIHCLEDSGFLTHAIDDPIDVLKQIIFEIKKKLICSWRHKKSIVKSTDAGGHFDEIFDSFLLMDQILEKLFNNKTKEEILDFSTYEDYHEFLIKLNDQEIE